MRLFQTPVRRRQELSGKLKFHRRDGVDLPLCSDFLANDLAKPLFLLGGEGGHLRRAPEWVAKRLITLKLQAGFTAPKRTMSCDSARVPAVARPQEILPQGREAHPQTNRLGAAQARWPAGRRRDQVVVGCTLWRLPPLPAFLCEAGAVAA